MENKLVVLAAGASSRMKKEGEGSLAASLVKEALEKSKSMIGLGSGGRPFLDYLLFNAWRAGYRDVVLVVGEDSAAFRSRFGLLDRGNEYHGLEISYAIQRIPEGRSKPLGTADALLQALIARPDWRGENFTVCNSDNLYSERSLRLLLESSFPNVLIDYDRRALDFTTERIEKFALLTIDAGGHLISIVEKPEAGMIEGFASIDGRVGVSMNIFRFAYDAIRPCLEECPLHPLRLEKELPAALMVLIRRQPGSVMTIPLAEHVPDLTGRDDIMAVQKMIEKEHRNFQW